jgi:hypothetical protein
LFHEGGRTDRWTDMTKLIVTFRNFANAPKNFYVYFENHTKLTNVVFRPNAVSSFCRWHNIETKCVLKGKNKLNLLTVPLNRQGFKNTLKMETASSFEPSIKLHGVLARIS